LATMSAGAMHLLASVLEISADGIELTQSQPLLERDISNAICLVDLDPDQVFVSSVLDIVSILEVSPFS
jgi:hypothetical protein